MDSPEKIADGIVDRFSWTSNVIRNGRMVGQQYIVAEAIADAIQKERDEIARLHAVIENEAIVSRELRTREEGLLRAAIDATWGEAMEDGSVPATKKQDWIIAYARAAMASAHEQSLGDEK